MASMGETGKKKEVSWTCGKSEALTLFSPVQEKASAQLFHTEVSGMGKEARLHCPHSDNARIEAR